jgi:hypothetical protein
MLENQKPESLAKLILTLLPEDGTPVANRIMRTMLARRLEARVGADQYFAAVDLLTKTDRVGRALGRGGGIFLAEAPTALQVAPEASPASPGRMERIEIDGACEAVPGKSVPSSPGPSARLNDHRSRYIEPRSQEWPMGSATQSQSIPHSTADAASYRGYVWVGS